MEIIADLHIHSRFSRACSKDLNLENLEKWAKIKGIGLMGTGDFSHEKWLNELKENLTEKDGILYSKTGFKFILTWEVSLIYTQNGKGRKVHLGVLAPSFEVVDKINAYLDKKGRRDYDGRPIFKITCEQFTKDMSEISNEIEIIPAHCLLPNTLIHTEEGVKKIKEIKIGGKILTHLGRFKKVKEVLSYGHRGKIYKITSWYFQEGTESTSEHPFLAIKSYKNCKSTKGLCKPLCSQVNQCKRLFYKKYNLEWVQAKNLEIGDVLAYPRLKNEEDLEEIDLIDYIKNFRNIKEDFIIHENARNYTGKIKRKIKLNNEFCRLIGYFLSEGYLITNTAIGFSFNRKEKEYIDEVISTIKNCFGFEITSTDTRRENQSDLIFNSKLLNSFFSNFYLETEKKSKNKILPNEFLSLPNEKLAEIFRGWWRGDTGNTVSRQLANQMKQICLKLGIIPSIYVYTLENHQKHKHFIGEREIIAKNDLIVFSNLSFFEKDYEMLKENCFKKSINKINRKHGWIDENYIYLPIRKIETREYSGDVYNLEVEEDNSYVSEFACLHNCWTPFFGVFGSESGFNSLKEAFGSQADKIHAIETGMSSDPEMNWKISELNNRAIVSFSDSHSFWPWRLGREATIFSKADSYMDIIKDIRENKILGTIETDPAYGKYHYDGHRDCNFSCSPEESKKLNNICPVCKKELVIGVENRVNEIGNQKPEINPHRKKYYKILPLHELISIIIGVSVSSKRTWEIYNKLIKKFENEFNILLNVSLNDLENIVDKKLAELIILNREGKLQLKPGYDGLYGEIILSEEFLGKKKIKKIKENSNEEKVEIKKEGNVKKKKNKKV